MMEEDIFKGLGVEVILDNEESFLKIKETLTRIGVLSKKDKILYQSVHILHKRGRYSIMHFKELFKMDNRPSDITENDIQRRNTIAFLLEEWELLNIKNPEIIEHDIVPLNQIKILSYKEKPDYELISKYQIGSFKKKI
jgi:hypothetical protein